MRNLTPCLLALLFSCNVAPPKNVGQPSRMRTADSDWSRSVTWLHATAKAPSGAAGECQHVHGVLEKEASCNGKMCGHAFEIGGEWSDKCAKLMPDQASSVAELTSTWRERVDEPPTNCFNDFVRLNEDSCEPSECVERGQRWATQCAEQEGSPLCVAIVQTMVNRNGEGGKKALDTRSCDSLTAALKTGAACADEAVCRRALEDVKVHQARCIEKDVTLPLAVALQRMAISAGAGEAPSPHAVIVGTELPEDAVPLVLADGQGAVLSVCGRRVTTINDYLDVRERCGGPVLFAAVRHSRLEVASLTAPSDVSFVDVFPRFALAGEIARAGEKNAESLRSALDLVVAATGPQAIEALATAMHDHQGSITKSGHARRVMTSMDDQLTPVFVLIGEAKARAGKATSQISVSRGILSRSKRRQLADVSRDGSIVALTPTRGSLLELGDILPKATKAYSRALLPLENHVNAAERIDRMTRRYSRDRPEVEARKLIVAANAACEQAQAMRAKAAAQLTACAFDPCDEQSILSLAQQVVDARDIAIVARHRYDQAASMTVKPVATFDCDPLSL
jgi:hypothetical protein